MEGCEGVLHGFEGLGKGGGVRGLGYGKGGKIVSVTSIGK